MNPAPVARSASELPVGLLKPALVLWLSLLLLALSGAPAGAAAPEASSNTNCAAVPVGWLQLPTREVVLNFRSEGLAYGCRRDAGEFLLSLLNQLLQAGYTVRLSDDFLLDEIAYYTVNQDREKPSTMSRDIVACLRQARRAQVLDWDCFKAIARSSGDVLSGGRHLPWMSPPVHSEAVRLTDTGTTNLAQLHLRLRWTGRPVRGAVQVDRRPGRLSGESVLIMGEDTLWSFSARMRLQQGEQTLFEKEYPQDPWQHTYAGAADLPVERAIQRILQDLDTGLKPKPEPPAQPKGKKPRKAKSEK